jgi:hypothetical protein
LTLHVVYGHHVSSNNDPYLEQAEECVTLLANRIASSGSIWLVDVLPFLKHVPAWLPGMQFKRDAQVWKRKMDEWVDKPYEDMKDRMVSLLSRGTNTGMHAHGR